MTSTDIQNRTEVPTTQNQQRDYILLDPSSSMTSKWGECLSALDIYVDGLRHNNVNSHITLQMFYAQNIEYIHRESHISDWRSLFLDVPGPRGGTKLYDAVNAMGQRLAQEDPSTCSIVIVTDGDDTSSITSVEQARSILDWCRAKGWQITFIGADFSNSDLAGLLGADRSEAIGVQKRLLGDAARNLSEKRVKYGLNGTPMHFTEEEQTQFGGYLAPPKS